MLRSLGLVAMLSMGFLAGCHDDGKHDMKHHDKMSDSSMMDRSGDKIIVTGAHGSTATYGWDKSAGKPMALTGEMTKCPDCQKAVADYYMTGKMTDQCKSCGAKMTVQKGSPTGSHGNM